MGTPTPTYVLLHARASSPVVRELAHVVLTVYVQLLLIQYVEKMEKLITTHVRLVVSVSM